MKKVWVEAGGKSPNIVLEDAHDLDKIAEASVEGFTFNQGEIKEKCVLQTPAF